MQLMPTPRIADGVQEPGHQQAQGISAQRLGQAGGLPVLVSSPAFMPFNACHALRLYLCPGGGGALRLHVYPANIRIRSQMQSAHGAL
jgi:hypothetical protein